MSNKRRRARVSQNGRNKNEQYFPLTYQMARSAAFRSLSGAALKVWIELRCRYNGYNNGQLCLSLQNAADLLRIGKTTAMRAFEELEEKGFVKLTRRGNWSGRRATEWAITDKPHKEPLATNDWKNWRPPDKSQLEKLTSRSWDETISTPDGTA